MPCTIAKENSSQPCMMKNEFSIMYGHMAGNKKKLDYK